MPPHDANLPGRSAGTLAGRGPAGPGPAGRGRLWPPSRPAGADLRHRPQHQLHEHLHVGMPVLRVLSAERLERRVRSFGRATAGQNRRGDRARGDAHPDARRPSSGAGAGLRRGTVAEDPRAFPGAPALFQPAGDRAPGPRGGAGRGVGAEAAGRGGAGQPARRRGGNPQRPGSPDSQPEQMHDGRMAGGDAGGAQSGAANYGDHDVRPHGIDPRAAGAPGPPEASAGRYGRFYSLYLLALPGPQHPPGGRPGLWGAGRAVDLRRAVAKIGRRRLPENPCHGPHLFG